MAALLDRLSARGELLGTIAAAAVTLTAAAAALALGIAAAGGTPGVATVALIALAAGAALAGLSALSLRRCVHQPLEVLTSETAALAGGELTRRVTLPRWPDLRELASAVNRLTDRLLEEQTHRLRTETLASTGRFAAGAAREMAPPAAALAAYVQQLREAGGEDERLIALAERLDREVAQVDRVVRGLADFSRVRPETLRPLDVNAVLRRVVDSLTSRGALRRVTLSLELAADAPFACGERDALELLFSHLLTNAVQAVGPTGTIAVHAVRMSRTALEEGQVRRAGDPPMKIVPHQQIPRVRQWLVAGRRSAEVVKIVVADSGPGVSAAHAERVFEPFFTTRAETGAAGLGLAVAARIVENFDGTIWVQKAREGGAAFHVIFPLVPASLASPASPPPPVARRPLRAPAIA